MQVSTTVPLKRTDDDIGALVIGMAAKKIDEQERVKVEGESRFADLLREYEMFLDKEDIGERIYITSSGTTRILTPEDINLFLQTTIIYEAHENYQWRTGLFISRLIQNSYNAGNTNFYLNTENLPIILWLGAFVSGTAEMPINITINENAGGWCGSHAEYLIFTLNGNTEIDCGLDTHYSTFYIKGNTGNMYGNYAKHSTFSIQGKIGSGWGLHAEYSTFKTPNKDTLQFLLQHVPDGNRIIFVHQCGREEVKRDYR